MKKILIALLVIISMQTYAQVSVNWVNYPGGVAVASDNLNNVYTANWSYGAGGDITLTKRDAAGNIIWEVAYDNTDLTRHEVATWVATDHDGNILVSGTIRSGYSNPVNAASVLMKFNASGTLLWRKVYESSFEGSSTVKCLVDASNNIYVLGLGYSGTGIVTKVKKFNASGTALWSYFDNAGIGAPVNFKFTPDQQLLIICRGTGINGYAKIDLNGNSIWTLTGINSLTVGDASGDAFGNTYLVHGEYVATNAGSYLKKLSPAGVLIWEKLNTITAFRVEVGSDNNPVISGFPNSGTPGAVFMKFNELGNLLWQNLDADGPGTALMMHSQMRLDGANAAYLAASTPYPGQMAVCKVNSDGTSAWLATAFGSYAYNLDFGTDNSVFVTGGATARFIQSAVPPPVAPAAPTALTATATGTTINLGWTDNAGNETGYVLQRSPAPGNSFVTIATLAANSSSYSNTGLAYSTVYYYRVQATGSNNTTSAWSNVANVSTVAPPPVVPSSPTNLTATSTGCTQITLNWFDNSNNETGFEIRRATSLNGTYSLVTKVGVNIRTYRNINLQRNKRYYYIVRSYNTAGTSAWSNKANALTTCIPVLKQANIENQLMLFPNPATNGRFTITLPNSVSLPVTMEILSAHGQKVYSNQLNSYNNGVQTKGLAKGWYIVRILNGDEVKNLKLLIE